MGLRMDSDARGAPAGVGTDASGAKSVEHRILIVWSLEGIGMTDLSRIKMGCAGYRVSIA